MMKEYFKISFKIAQKIVLFCLLISTIILSACSKDEEPQPSQISFTLQRTDYSFQISPDKPYGEMKFEFKDRNKNNIGETGELELTTISIEGMGPIKIAMSRLEILQDTYRFKGTGLSDIVFDFEPSSCPVYTFDEKFVSPETIFTFRTIQLGDLIERSDPVDPDSPVIPTFHEIYDLNKLDIDFTLEVSSINCDGSQSRAIVSDGRIIINK